MLRSRKCIVSIVGGLCMGELETLQCIAGYFNAHIGETERGEDENVGKYEGETRNRWSCYRIQ